MSREKTVSVPLRKDVNLILDDYLESLKYRINKCDFIGIAVEEKIERDKEES